MKADALDGDRCSEPDGFNGATPRKPRRELAL
jgi:hypothetical protein